MVLPADQPDDGELFDESEGGLPTRGLDDPASLTPCGFEFVDFTDHYGLSCSLQMSSLFLGCEPGGSAVWLGPEGHRMHLNRLQVGVLIDRLQSWLDENTFDGTPIGTAFK